MTPILFGLVNVALVILMAPFYEGVLRKVTARIQSRRGPPLIQPFYDLLKLLGRRTSSRRSARHCSACGLHRLRHDPDGRAAPADGGLAAPGRPRGRAAPCLPPGTPRVSTLLAGFAAGSVYSLVGLSREMMCMMTLEPLLAVSLLVGAIHAGSLRLDAVLDGAVYAGPFPSSGLHLLGVGLFAFQAFVGRLPFDTTEAETEIMEGPLMEYSVPSWRSSSSRGWRRSTYTPPSSSRSSCPGEHRRLPPERSDPSGEDPLPRPPRHRDRRDARPVQDDQVLRYYALLLGVSVFVLVLAIQGIERRQRPCPS